MAMIWLWFKPFLWWLLLFVRFLLGSWQSCGYCNGDRSSHHSSACFFFIKGNFAFSSIIRMAAVLFNRCKYKQSSSLILFIYWSSIPFQISQSNSIVSVTSTIKIFWPNKNLLSKTGFYLTAKLILQRMRGIYGSKPVSSSCRALWYQDGRPSFQSLNLKYYTQSSLYVFVLWFKLCHLQRDMPSSQTQYFASY